MIWLATAVLLVPAVRGVEAEAIRRARQALAAELAANATVVSATPVRWPRGRLDCGTEPTRNRTRSVAGYRIVLRIEDRVHTVHVGAGRAVACGSVPVAGPVPAEGSGMQNEKDATPSPGSPRDERVDHARADLARRLNRPESDIAVVKAEAVTWRDGSLGCPKPGMMYTQALVPGYLIVLRHGDRTYEYHAGRAGRPSLCEGTPQEPLPRDEGSVY